MIFLASDHGGYKMKEAIRAYLAGRNLPIEDLGVFRPEKSDYPPLARQAAKLVVKHRAKAILFCRSGQGMAIAANRLKGIRAVVVWNEAVAKEAREDNDANVLSIAADYLNEEQVKKIVSTFLSTTFSGEDRHRHRIKQIDELL